VKYSAVVKEDGLTGLILDTNVKDLQDPLFGEKINLQNGA
jgi:hypothetical protein